MVQLPTYGAQEKNVKNTNKSDGRRKEVSMKTTRREGANSGFTNGGQNKGSMLQCGIKDTRAERTSISL